MKYNRAAHLTRRQVGKAFDAVVDPLYFEDFPAATVLKLREEGVVVPPAGDPMDFPRRESERGFWKEYWPFVGVGVAVVGLCVSSAALVREGHTVETPPPVVRTTDPSERPGQIVDDGVHPPTITLPPSVTLPQ